MAVHTLRICYNDKMKTPSAHPSHKLYFYKEILMFMLALTEGALLVAELTSQLSPSSILKIDVVDIAIACIFLADFFITFTLTTKKALFLKKHWWELFAAIPVTTDLTQALRLLRLLRIGRFMMHLELLKQDGEKLIR